MTLIKKMTILERSILPQVQSIEPPSYNVNGKNEEVKKNANSRYRVSRFTEKRPKHLWLTNVNIDF